MIFLFLRFLSLMFLTKIILNRKKIQLCLTKIWSNKRSYVLTSLFNYVWPFFTTFLYLHETAALFTKETLKVKRFFLWCDYFTVLYFPKETLQERWGKLFFRKQHFSFLRFITYNHLNWSSFPSLFVCFHAELPKFSSNLLLKSLKLDISCPVESYSIEHTVNPFLANVLILYPLKTPENIRFSGVFRGYKVGTYREKLKLILITFRV